MTGSVGAKEISLKCPTVAESTPTSRSCSLNPDASKSIVYLSHLQRHTIDIEYFNP